jgi:hypothetical protein
MSSPPASPTPARALKEPASGPPSPALQELRARHGVRPLKPEEEGSAVAKLPNGVYGFTYAPGAPEVPLFSKHNYHSFEVHKAADGTEYVLGFVTPPEASEIAALEIAASQAAAPDGARMRIYPAPWETAQTLVAAPASRMVAAKRMPREDGNPLPFTLA